MMFEWIKKQFYQTSRLHDIMEKSTLTSIVLCVIWLSAVSYIKIAVYDHHAITTDILLWANAIANTDFHEKWLYVANYHVSRGEISLLQDHFEPSSLSLTALSWFSDIPLALNLYQGLAAAAIVYGLVETARCLANRPDLGWVVAVLTLYNPYFIDAVVNGGFHHDAQYLLYLPLFTLFFIKKQTIPALLLLLLFMGTKQSAAFYTLILGGWVAVFDLPLGRHRRIGAMVAAISLIYLILAIFIFPQMIGSPNFYANKAMGLLHGQPGPLILETIRNFFQMNWYAVIGNFPFALGSPGLFLASIPDAVLCSLVPRPGNVYYNYCVVTLLGFATLTTILRVNAGSAPQWMIKIAKPAAFIFTLQVIGTTLYGVHELYHIWYKASSRDPVTIATSTAEGLAALNMVRQDCTVGVNVAMTKDIYRLPYLLFDGDLTQAKYIISFKPSVVVSGRFSDDAFGFVTDNQSLLKPIGETEHIQVWEDPTAPCRPDGIF